MKHVISRSFFLLMLVASPIMISGNLQNVYGLTPVADLTGEWSGTGQFTSNYYDVSCAATVSISAKISQNDNNVSGSYSFVGTSAKDLNPDPEYGDRCALWEASGGTFSGQLDGSRISVTLSDDGLTYKGTYTSRLIKLSVSTAELSGTIQLAAISLSNPDYQPKETDSDGDGIPDNKDQCPSQKEDNVGNRDGCPEKNSEIDSEKETEIDKTKDSDGDGVPDFVDLCEDKAASGTKFGCPTQENTPTSTSDAKILDNELKQIQEELRPEDWVVPIGGETPGLLRDKDDSGKPLQKSDYDSIKDKSEAIQDKMDTLNLVPKLLRDPNDVESTLVFPTRLPDNFFRTNGCGGQGMAIDPVPDFDFTESCNKHDICYALGGTGDDRKKCDMELYESIKYNSVIGDFGATAYYWGIRTFGNFFFNCEDDSCYFAKDDILTHWKRPSPIPEDDS